MTHNLQRISGTHSTDLQLKEHLDNLIDFTKVKKVSEYVLWGEFKHVCSIM